MIQYFLIEKQALLDIENAAHDIKSISDSIQITEHANKIIDRCNEPIQLNTALSLRGINRLLDNMLQTDYNFTKLDQDVNTIKELLLRFESRGDKSNDRRN